MSGTLVAAATPTEGGVPPQIRFMVFKVKQRAEINYFAKTTNDLDDERFKFKFRAMENSRAPQYSYNWPYDFFSLVETAKINMSVTLRNKRLIDDVRLQDLSQMITLEPVVDAISSAVASSMPTTSGVFVTSVSEASVRAASRASSAAGVVRAAGARYGAGSPTSTGDGGMSPGGYVGTDGGRRGPGSTGLGTERETGGGLGTGTGGGSSRDPAETGSDF